jgi:hypothetical protein
MSVSTHFQNEFSNGCLPAVAIFVVIQGVFVADFTNLTQFCDYRT